MLKLLQKVVKQSGVLSLLFSVIWEIYLHLDLKPELHRTCLYIFKSRISPREYCIFMLLEA